MDKALLISEVTFKAVRSSGPGGQNVNKVASKILLSFDLVLSKALSEDEKALLQIKLASKLSQENILSITSQEDRSQLKNKEIATKKFLKIIENGLKIDKPRKETKIPRGIKEKRLNAKKVMSVLKQNRKKPNF
ncbi:MAG: alternative ribosome rescue aminoacyl-tRNA hydrolase ArfB [Flavobacterium sp.]|jgi:ribosome-associated protein